jgi:hypothetical protein
VQRRRWFLANGKLNLEVWDLHLIYIYNIYIYIEMLSDCGLLMTVGDLWPLSTRWIQNLRPSKTDVLMWIISFPSHQEKEIMTGFTTVTTAVPMHMGQNGVFSEPPSTKSPIIQGWKPSDSWTKSPEIGCKNPNFKTAPAARNNCVYSISHYNHSHSIIIISPLWWLYSPDYIVKYPMALFENGLPQIGLEHHFPSINRSRLLFDISG